MGLFSSSSDDNYDRSRGNTGRSDNTGGLSGSSDSGDRGGHSVSKQQQAQAERDAIFQQQQAAARQPAGQQTSAMMEANEEGLANYEDTGRSFGSAAGAFLGPFSAFGAPVGEWIGGQLFNPEVIPGANPQSLVSGHPMQPSNQQNNFVSGSGNPQQGGGWTGGTGVAAQGQQDNRSPGQIEMDRQDAFLQYAGGLYHPSMQRGEQASSELFDYYSGNQQPMQDRVNQSVMNSPFLAQNIAQGEDAIARNRQATGGFRSGTTQENLAQNSQNQYQNLYNQQLNQNLQGLGMFGDYGANALNNYSNFGRGMINDIGTTSGNIQSQNVANDAIKQNERNAWIGALGQGIAGYFNS